MDEIVSEENQYDFYPLSNLYATVIIEKIMDCAKQTFDLLQMSIYGRVDFRITSQGEIYIFDIATTPYTTLHSSFAFAFAQLGLEYSDIYDAIITASLAKSKRKELKVR